MTRLFHVTPVDESNIAITVPPPALSTV